MIDCRIFAQRGAAFIVFVLRDQDSFCQSIAQEMVKRGIPAATKNCVRSGGRGGRTVPKP
jgi:hypothetical protein